MASSIPSPPRTPFPDTDDQGHLDPFLVTRLDTLLSQYLVLLDTYTSLRHTLSAEFSSGLLSLAHANRTANSTLGAGRRYDQHGYDERMKALRGVKIATLKFDPVAEPASSPEQETGDGVEADMQISPADIDRPEPDSESIPKLSCTPKDAEVHRSHVESLYNTYTSDLFSEPSTKNDPLRWYGLFVPPALRQCQASFTSIISNIIPSLLTTSSRMQALEHEIWKLRIELGILEGYELPDKHSAHPVSKKANGVEHSTLATLETRTSNKSLSNLVSRSRPSEPKTRVLKVD